MYVLSKTPCGLSPPSPVPFWTILLESPAAEQHPKNIKNGPPNLRKSRSGGVWKGPGAVLGAILGHLGSKLRLQAALAIFGRAWMGQDGAKMSPKGAKRSQVGAKLAGSCGQDAPRSTQERLLGAMLGASWPIWGAFLEYLAEKAAKQKTLKNQKFS